MANSNRKRLWITGGGIAGLTIGFLLGALAHARGDYSIRSVATLLAPIGSAWINAVRMTVFPLVIAQLVASLARTNGLSAARVGTVGVATVVTMLVAAGVAALAIVPLLLQALPWDPEALVSFRTLAADTPPPQAAPAPTGHWLPKLVPANPLRAAVEDDLLAVMIFAIAFGIAVRGMAPERRALVAETSQLVSDAMITIIGWVMWLMPVAAFVFALSMGTTSGAGGARIFGFFIVGCSGLLLFFILLLYPIGAFGARMPIRRFAAMLLPAQLVGFSTRSSTASLPSMMECARSGLRLRPEVSGLVLPMVVSTFRVSVLISPAFDLLFLAHVYGIELSAVQVVTFAIAMLVLSFSSPGIPTAGVTRSAPFYLAAGIPLEGYLIIEALDAVPDLFKTVLNVTAHLTAAALINRQVDVMAAARHAKPTAPPAIDASTAI